ncbi:ATP-binding cassette domain-containing protein [Dactylosporangium sp. AC04546]|uniref:ATP-binding cassette domain-containing protein n=1 Tax=Dactylosporangium sp. AC04546 TaxID=2862460 RepID=UPI0027E14ADD|nr:ATP-binding cassette domain-containing protein [Dactylosporangium sp. AC04546]WVK79055.1 ATP-binding cassette domain-containing protein [Dactylosporangium sp. AC04546]
MMIHAHHLTKRFGEVTALADVTLDVPAGTIAGLLGHNGAGKTTLVNILATLQPPTSGTAAVAGFDVVRQGRDVRRAIGLTGQFAALDEQLSGLDNLVLIARLLGAPRRAAAARAAELIEAFDLAAAAKRPVRTYSGGMKRRLDLAAGIVGQPRVIFLDEPTTGLDPISRAAVWDIVENLVDDGATVLLTTQYLEEADRLAHSITVLSDGRVVASGTPDALKAGVGQRTVHVTLTRPEDAGTALRALERTPFAVSFDDGKQELNIPVGGSTDLVRVATALADSGVELAGLELTDPTLDDVYISLSRKTTAAA